MKWLRVISSTNPASGGPIEGIRQLQAPLSSLGIGVDIASCDLPQSPWLGSIGLEEIRAFGVFPNKYAYSPTLMHWLRHNAQRYEAVIVHGLWQYHGYAVWRALAGTKTPYFVFTHGMLDPWFKRTYPLKHLKKWLYWPWAEYRVLRDATAVLFTSEEERLLARESFCLYKAEERVVNYGTSVPYGNADEKRAVFLQAFPDLKDKRVLLFLSRIHPKKGCDLLLRAFATKAAVDERLHLVMAGPDQVGWGSQLQKLSQRLGIGDRVSWPGMLQGDLKWGAFYAAETFILPSHQENFGIAVAEALACGVPVLISNKVNIWREIQRDEAGVVADDTAEGVVELLDCWLSMSIEKRSRMAISARSCFEKRFDVQAAAQSLIDVISELRYRT
jgi:glycosyltransferase involved in cell wall biosynthesis